MVETTQQVNFYKSVVVLGSFYEIILPVIQKFKIKTINNVNWEAGQSTSVKLGVSYFLDDQIEAILFLLVDQPQITSRMINNVLNLFAYQKDKIIVHSYKGQYRHPILFSKKIFKDLLNIHGEQGGRQLFERYSPVQINLENDFLALDIDTIKDLKNLES